MSTARAAFGALLAALIVWGGYVTAHPYVSEQSQALPVQADWTARADAWFTAKDETARRKEMREMTRALRQPCRYCHTPDFTGYTDKQLISQQMMALSAEHAVACADCHTGKNDLSDLGKVSAVMWALSAERKTFCGTCHVKHERFGKLTPEGQTFYETEWRAWKAAYDARATPAPPAAPAAPAPTAPAPTAPQAAPK